MGEGGKERREGEGRSLNSACLHFFTIKRMCVCVCHSLFICGGEGPSQYDDKVSVLCVYFRYCTDHSASYESD